MHNEDTPRPVTDRSASLFNTVVKARAHDKSGRDRPSIQVTLPSWGFSVSKGGIQNMNEQHGISSSQSRVEALILIEHLKPAIEICERARAVTGVTPIINIVADWGCASALLHASIILAEVDCVCFHISRCRIHCYGNWCADACRRALCALRPSSQWSLSQVTDLIFWETRAMQNNKETFHSLVAEFAESTPITPVLESAVPGGMSSQKLDLYSLMKFFFELLGLGKRDERVRNQEGMKMKRSLACARKFLWMAGKAPKRVVKDLSEWDERKAKGELRELLTSLSVWRGGNLARWLSMGSCCVDIYLIRWCMPQAMPELFKRVQTRDDKKLPQMHIGAGDFINEDQIIKNNNLQFYLTMLMTIFLFTSPGDRATRAARRRVGQVRKYRNSEIHKAFIDGFDDVVRTGKKAMIFLSATLTHVNLKEGKENIVLGALVSWRVGFGSMWGQYMVQQGAEIKTHEFAINASTILGQGGDTETVISALEGLVSHPVQSQYDISRRSIVNACSADLRKCEAASHFKCEPSITHST